MSEMSLRPAEGMSYDCHGVVKEAMSSQRKKKANAARSPAYPAIGLREAVKAVEGIYKNVNRNTVTREVAASHMGYTSLNGTSLGALSALLKYGLLEGRANNTRVTERAAKICDNEVGSPIRVQALEQAAVLPEQFGVIRKHPEAYARSLLVSRGYSTPAVDLLIRAYHETVSFIESETTRLAQEGPKHPSTITGATVDNHNEKSDLLFDEERTVLKEGAVVLRIPRNISSASAAYLKKWLELMIEKTFEQAAEDKSN